MEVKKEVNKKKIYFYFMGHKMLLSQNVCESSVSDNCFLKISYLFLI